MYVVHYLPPRRKARAGSWPVPGATLPAEEIASGLAGEEATGSSPRHESSSCRALCTGCCLKPGSRSGSLPRSYVGGDDVGTDRHALMGRQAGRSLALENPLAEAPNGVKLVMHYLIRNLRPMSACVRHRPAEERWTTTIRASSLPVVAESAQRHEHENQPSFERRKARHRDHRPCHCRRGCRMVLDAAQRQRGRLAAPVRQRRHP